MTIPAMFTKRPAAAPVHPPERAIVVADNRPGPAPEAPLVQYIPAPTDVVVRYAPSSAQELQMGRSAGPGTSGHGRYHLLEIGADLEKEIERLGKDGERVSLTIKGRPSDDAVLCTQTRTYALRSITVSNSLLVLQPPAAASSSHASPESDLDLTATSGSNRTTFSPALSTKRRRTRSTSSSTPPRTLQLAATSHEILEAQPCPPRLERIGMLLRPSAWAGMEVDRWEGRAGDDDVPRGLGRRWTRRKLESVVQASDEELSRGLRERRVIEWDDDLMLLPAVHLVPLLSILLNLLTLHADAPESLETASAPPSAASYPPVCTRCSTAPLLASLAASHGLPAIFVRRVLALFGKVDGADWWACDVREVIRAVGEGLLWRIRGQGSGASMGCGRFLDLWKEEVGASWDDRVDLSLLEGEYLSNPPAHGATSTDPRYHTLVPFPSSLLPADPPTRFAELFLTRPRWRPNEMRPFLRGLVPDAANAAAAAGGAAGKDKALDKLVVKYVRVSKEGKGGAEVTWWYPRRT